MKQNKISISYQVLGIFGVFVVGIISFLWLFQIVFLNDFYRLIKLNEIKNSAKIIESSLSADNFQEVFTSEAGNNQQCIQIINLNTNTRVSVEGARNCAISKMGYNSIISYYSLAKQNKNQYYEITKNSGYMLDNVYIPANNNNESLIYAKIVNHNDVYFLLVLNSSIIPVDATVNTLRVQLICLTFILLFFSIILAVFIAKKITKPIMEINESAKVLATGNYQVEFKGQGYKEIAELETTLNYAARELSKVEALRNELIANISHDLRTPLTMIGGYAQVMKDLPGENTPENVQIIIDETARLSSLVNDVLDISKLTSDTQELRVEEFDITQVLIDLQDRFEKLLDKDGYHIELKFDKHYHILADEVRITQVLYNLLNNAITYTGDDKLVIINQRLVGDYVRIEIIDHGVGISIENQALIWDRYYKANNQHKRAVNGSGLGLSIVKSVLELHNTKFLDVARYGVNSVENVGSTFYIEYKIVKEKAL